jgi:hypothetical protein
MRSFLMRLAFYTLRCSLWSALSGFILWWLWVFNAHDHPRPQTATGFPSYFVSTLQQGLREPVSTLSVYILFCYTIAIIFWIVFYGVTRFFSHYSPVHYSAWVDWLYPPITIRHSVQSKDGIIQREASEFRDLFTIDSFMLDKAYLAEGNPHKYAAQRRLAAVNMAHAISKKLGLPIHDEQMSRRGAKRGYNGTRTIMSAKDACSYTADNLKYESIRPGSLVTHIDTFTHKDLNDANATLSDGNIHYLYTWNPDEVAGKSDELLFRYEEDGEFVTTVEGSDSYRDKLWRFEGDCLVTHSHAMQFTWQTFFFITFAAVIFCYNVYTNRVHNQSLINAGPFGYLKFFEQHLYYPVPTVNTFTNYDGYTDTVWQLVNGYGMSPTWLSLFEGMRHPYIMLSHITLQYPWTVQPDALTLEHWFAIFSVLLLALFWSYTPIAISHKVTRIDVGEHRSIVVIVPNCKFRGFAALARPFLSDADLRPRTPLVCSQGGGHKILAERRKKPSGYSVSYLGSYEAHHLDDKVVDMAKTLSTDKGAPSISNVRVSTKSEGDEASRVAAAVAIAIITNGEDPFSYSSNYGFYPMPTIIRQDDKSKANGETIKEVMAHGAMPPVVSGAAYIHARSEAQTRDFVKRRLKDPAAKVDSRFTPETVMYINEFADRIRKEVLGEEIKGFLQPISEQEYIETRSKNQLNKFNEVLPVYDIHNFDDRQGFMKREVLPNPAKAARGICCFPAETQALGGRISLAYAAAMKRCQWMACGLNPSETTNAVLRVCCGAVSITDTDFSAQDATIDENKRLIELALLLQLFDKEWHDIIKDWHYTDYHGRVLYGDKGTKREPHQFNGSRGSEVPSPPLATHR